MAQAKRKSDDVTVIKKYANRRLYDTGRSSYVTLEDLYEMVKEGHEFAVYDAKSGEDITRQVLTQIIMDQESKGENMLPIPFLRQLIGFYGDNLQALLPNYLEQTLNSFASNQEEFRKQVNKSLEGMRTAMTGGADASPMATQMKMMEDMSRKNMQIFQNAMKSFTPFATTMQQTANDVAKATDDQIETLKDNIAKMEKEIERLSKKA